MPYCFSIAFKVAAATGMLAAVPCPAQPVALPRTEVSGKLIHDPELLSYRDARRSIETFERYAKPKELIRFQYELSPKNPEGFSFEGLTFAIEDDENLVVLPHVRGVAEVPLHPPIDERKARFVINRQKGQLTLRYGVSTAIRDDQRYDQGHLRRGCEQAHDLIRTQSVLNELMEAGKKCVGVRVVLLSDDAIVIRRDVDGRESELPVSQGRLDRYALVRWSEDLDSIEVRPLNRPHVLAIVTE